MNKVSKIAVILGLGACLASPSYAASQMDIIAFQTSLSDMNRLKPLQNPRHELSKDILGGTLSDRENKVVGTVEDILVDDDGYVQTLFTDLDRLHLGDAVFLDYNDMGVKNMSDGYKLGMNSAEISAAYPELLGNIETASGQNNLISVKNLRGTEVWGTENIRLGEISEILFDKSGTYLRGIYLNVDYKTIRAEGIAIPFDALSYEEKNGKPVAIIDQDYADAVVKHLKDQ